MESKEAFAAAAEKAKRPQFNERSPLKMPTLNELKDVAKKLGFTLQQHDEEAWVNVIRGHLTALQVVDTLPDFVPSVKYARTPGRFPSTEENPLNAWYVKTDIQGSAAGKLHGKTVALKDSVSVAGVPMMNGSNILEGHVPSIDATIVTRILDAGGRILGKAACEDLCLSGGSHTNAKGQIRNPRNVQRSAGGSSSGSGAVIAAGEVDLAIGGDQGGSIRIPASFCGIVGMKPTFGLVPYTGIIGIMHTIDHTGPMSANVEDNAVFLEALAGPDDFDPRQGPPGSGHFPTNFDADQIGGPLAAAPDNDYTSDLKNGVQGTKIGLLLEGLEGCEASVVKSVRAAADKLKALGATVEEVSVPMHNLGGPLWSSVVLQRTFLNQCFGNGHGLGYSGVFDLSLMNRFQNGVNSPLADTLSDSGKALFLAAQYTEDHFGPGITGKGHNNVRKLRYAYNKALSAHDVLIMPTLTRTASPLPADNAGPEENNMRSFEMIKNTCPFNLTGHPAISLPCGNDEENLPIGLQIVGRHLDEATVYRVAYAFEQS